MEMNIVKIVFVMLVTCVPYGTLDILGVWAVNWVTKDEEFILKHTILFPDGFGKVHKVALDPPKGPVSRSWFEVKAPEFWLFTRENPKEPQKLNPGDTKALKESLYSSEKKVKIISHGWSADRKSSICVLLKDALLAASDVNVFIIDWSSSAKKAYYFARTDLDKVATYVAKFLDFLHTDGGSPVDEIHMMGHSLGGHLIGLSSRRTKYGKVKRITAMDPALPLFTIDNSKHRIDKSDTKYLEVVHTSGGVLGFMAPLGHADLYVNGGKTQPGCGLDPTKKCAHMRSYELYAEVIMKHAGFTLIKCKSLEEVKEEECAGERLQWTVNSDGTGFYYLETSALKPFSIAT